MASVGKNALGKIAFRVWEVSERNLYLLVTVLAFANHRALSAISTSFKFEFGHHRAERRPSLLDLGLPQQCDHPTVFCTCLLSARPS